MCQISVVVVGDGGEELLAAAITGLVVSECGIRCESLFDDPVIFEGCILERIDFLAGKVFLRRLG